ncbi:hypothetical protein BDV26DRAFT_290380 [Aspergillus bertholletiae]|uniref:BZIP domain-containing protein n=1 Tax=Aspergillus bertholletiae TaxID=1226010 RepID=A0A5N7BFR0_9EURO|nr:hypothetical protein BDV26DRAFT_290380 [Aspergillus bertholletiae]
MPSLSSNSKNHIPVASILPQSREAYHEEMGPPMTTSNSKTSQLHCSTTNEDIVDPESDWHGITDRDERRCRQNRLNQRSYRKRQRFQVNNVAVILRSCNRDIDSSTKHRLLHLVTSAAYQNYIRGNLASDHLLTLTRANVYRAFLANITLLGLPVEGLCEANILSPFNLIGPAPPVLELLPQALSPTSTQRSCHHHPWVDFFPYPQVRDNLIRAQGRYDKHQFCLDILGFWDPGTPENMLLVWGEPCDPLSWEVTESFIKKWGWVIRGCPDIMYSTNQWRARRGENMIFRYL